MAGFLVTVNFTRNSVATQAVIYVGATFAANAVAAMNLGVTVAENELNVKAAASGDTLVFGLTSVVATSA